MIRYRNQLIFDVGQNEQITITGYDWRNAILNWTTCGLYHFSFELFRFKIEWHNYGSIT